MNYAKEIEKAKEWFIQDSRSNALTDVQNMELQRTVMVSSWFADWLNSQTNWLSVWRFIQADVQPEAELFECAKSWTIDDEAGVMKDLRLWRNRHIARLIARDVLQLNDVQATAKAVSDLADHAVQVALKWASLYWQHRDGLPHRCAITGEPTELIVIALGKHGAEELNLSSDIDLMFVYSSSGETERGQSHERFFTRVGQKLIHLLDARTSDGFVFRVDMRLRPWGQGGTLVSNFAALENYYLQQGRFWERFALVKARPLTGDKRLASYLTDIIVRPFVYRSYVDYQAIAALRELKAKIQSEVRRQNLTSNIKLGSGGIREVEFIAQVFQLIRGGKEPRLQVRGTWSVLGLIGQLGLLPKTDVTLLADSYNFLRDLEHRIQAIRDEQTQNLPTAEADLQRLALSLRFETTEQFLETLEQMRQQVHQCFNEMVAEEQGSSHRSARQQYVAAWQDHEGVAEADTQLGQSILAFQRLPSVQQMSGEARANLDRFMPQLWTELSRVTSSVEAFAAIRALLEAILRRSSYFSLLAENPQAIRELIKLAPFSLWVAKQLAGKPYLLDELTDTNRLYVLPSRAELDDELHQLLLRVPEEDLEQQMEVLRHFRHGRALRAAACEITGMLPLMKISDYLAWVAEVVVEHALAIAWQALVKRHGRPTREDGEFCDTDFGVIAYGKAGGLELSYESDLDLVFIHDAASLGQTEGPKVIDNSLFMARLGQKLIHILTTATYSGRLYEVDTRLRPSGASGLLVSSLNAFEKYQLDDAWTWEHQALVRARFIAGDAGIKAKFDELKRRILSQVREPQALRDAIIEMRQKMRTHLASDDLEQRFHLKHDPGGIVDLEFLVQFLVLNHAHEFAGITRWSDNVRIIEDLKQAGIISARQAEDWHAAYLTLREQQHHSILSGESQILTVAALSDEALAARQVIQAAWKEYFGT